MTLSARKFENRLLAHHLFPRIAKRGDEFPPCFVSTSLASDIASKLIARTYSTGGAVVRTSAQSLGLAAASPPPAGVQLASAGV